MASQAPDIIYLHGFRSSPASEKARSLSSYIDSVHYSGQRFIPELVTSPSGIEEQLDRLIQSRGRRPVGLIGSSLGGFFAFVMAERYGLPAVLINPAAYPYELMADYLGIHTNLYTGDAFEVTQTHIDQLRALDPGEPAQPQRLMVMVQTGDETLDYRQAAERFRDTHLVIEQGGDHRFSTFETHLPQMLAFLAKHGAAPTIDQ